MIKYQKALENFLDRKFEVEAYNPNERVVSHTNLIKNIKVAKDKSSVYSF